MTNENQINSNYQQSGNICVLASYWIVLSYFSDNTIGDLYNIANKLRVDNYINYNNDKNLKILEDNIGKAFNDYCKTTRQNIRGYQFIEDIHKKHFDNICSIAYTKWENGSNKNFHLSDINIKEISKILIDEEALALLTYSTANGFHSIVVGYSPKKSFFKRDTNDTATTAIKSLSDISNGNICEAIVFKKTLKV